MNAKPGTYGFLATIGTGWLSWTVKHDADLRACLLLLSLIIALFTVAWWIRKFWRVWLGRHDKKVHTYIRRAADLNPPKRDGDDQERRKEND